MRFTDLINSINDFSANFDPSKAIIVRRKNNHNYDVETESFNIKLALESPKSEVDPLLKLYDEVLVFSLGYNDDTLNDEQIYNPNNDPDHPLYLQGESQGDPTTEEIDSSLEVQNQPNFEKEHIIEMYNLKKIEEFDLINKGKRRFLLQPLISKLQQQASSSEPPKLVSISGAVKVPGNYPLTKMHPIWI